MKRVILILSIAGGVTAYGQYADDFEPPVYTGSGAGVELNGQNGYYNPNPAGSVSANVYTYAGNALGLPQNPFGGEQFAAGTGPGNSIYVRSQKDVPYPGGIVTLAFDIATTFTGQLPSADNVGSFSTQDSATTAGLIALARWTDPAAAANWNADYVWYDAAGTQLTESVPDPFFQGLMTNHWYRWSTTVDFDTNQVLEVTLTDLTGGGSSTYNPVDRYLQGGSAGGLPMPFGFRLFAGTSTIPGNTMAFDNLEIIPSPASLAVLGLAGLVAGRRRR